MDVIFLKSLRPLYCDYISRILCVRRAQQGRPPRPPFMYFYSRPYARGDSVRTLAISSTIPISTHAPTRGAMRPAVRVSGAGSNFYSRPYARGDSLQAPAMRELPGFLLTPLHEGRHVPVSRVCRHYDVFLLTPLREGRQQFFTKPQVDLYDKLLKIHIFQINTFCILQHSFENFKDYFVGSARTSRINVYGKGWR